jgi:hypothetical protein
MNLMKEFLVEERGNLIPIIIKQKFLNYIFILNKKWGDKMAKTKKSSILAFKLLPTLTICLTNSQGARYKRYIFAWVVV